MIDLPPMVYQHSNPLVTEFVVSLQRLAEFCGSAYQACAFFLADKCFIVLPKVGVGGVAQHTQDLLRIHEIGHCNGWSADHR